MVHQAIISYSLIIVKLFKQAKPLKNQAPKICKKPKDLMKTKQAKKKVENQKCKVANIKPRKQKRKHKMKQAKVISRMSVNQRYKQNTKQEKKKHELLFKK